MPAKKFVDPADYYPDITDAGVKDLYKLVEIVYNCHFSYASEHKEDLYSVGLVKAIDFIRSGAFDATRSSLKNVLYTGIRNEMKNYLHKLSRDTPVEDEILSGANEAEGVRVDDVFILGRISLPRCKEIGKVLASLQYYGFEIGVKPKFYPEVKRWLSLAIYQMIRGAKK